MEKILKHKKILYKKHKIIYTREIIYMLIKNVFVTSVRLAVFILFVLWT